MGWWAETVAGFRAVRAAGQQKSTPLNELSLTQVQGWLDPGAPDRGVAGLQRRGYQQSGAVFACARAYARAFPEPPYYVYHLDGARWPAHRAQALLDAPNPMHSGRALRQFLVTYAALGGNAYLYKWRSAANRIGQLLPFHTGEMYPVVRPGVPDPAKGWIDHYEYAGPSGPQRVEPADLVHWRWMPDPEHPWAGMSPLRPVAREIGTDLEMTRFLEALLLNDALPRSALKIPPSTVLTEGQRQDLRRDFRQQHGRDNGAGQDNRGGVALLYGGIEYVRMSMNLQELAFDALRAVPEARIAADFGVPAQVAGLNVGLEHATYSNFEEARYAFTALTLVPLWLDLGDVLTAGLRPDFGDDFVIAPDLTAVEALKENQEAVRSSYIAGWNAGLLNLNEARTPFGVAAVEGGDIFKAPAPIGVALQELAGVPAGKGA